MDKHVLTDSKRLLQEKKKKKEFSFPSLSSLSALIRESAANKKAVY